MLMITGNTVKDITAVSTNGIGIDNAIGVIIRDNQLTNCKRGVDIESSSGSPVSMIEIGGNTVRDCDIGVRCAGTTGTGVVKLDKNHFSGTFTYRYAFDSAFQ